MSKGNCLKVVLGNKENTETTLSLYMVCGSIYGPEVEKKTGDMVFSENNKFLKRITYQVSRCRECSVKIFNSVQEIVKKYMS